MKKLFSVAVCALMASCGGHAAYAMDLSKENRSPRIEDQRGDYVLAAEDIVEVQGSLWVRLTYLPSPWLDDQTLKICIKPFKQADYTGLPLICMDIIQQTTIEKGIY
jgi:hypothetical protein